MRLLPLLMMLIAAGFSSPAPAQISSTSEELHRLVAEKQYAPALQKITAALALKGTAAKTVNRYELLMLKAECHLQTKGTRMATEAYALAAKEATDERERALAAAHEALVKQSKAFAYTPKFSATGARVEKTRPAPIDILDPSSRKKAFAAFLADELAANDAKLKAAKSAQSLPPIAEMFQPLAVMEGLEIAATDAAEKVKALRMGLTDQAKKVVADALRGLSKRVGEIDKDANTFIEFFQEVPDPSGLGRFRRERAYKKKGLSDRQTKELADVNATCDKIPPALSEMAAQLRTEEKVFEPLNEEASRIRKEVDRVLDIDYMRVYKELPKR